MSPIEESRSRRPRGPSLLRSPRSRAPSNGGLSDLFDSNEESLPAKKSTDGGKEKRTTTSSSSANMKTSPSGSKCSGARFAVDPLMLSTSAPASSEIGAPEVDKYWSLRKSVNASTFRTLKVENEGQRDEDLANPGDRDLVGSANVMRYDNMEISPPPSRLSTGGGLAQMDISPTPSRQQSPQQSNRVSPPVDSRDTRSESSSFKDFSSNGDDSDDNDPD